MPLLNYGIKLQHTNSVTCDFDMSPLANFNDFQSTAMDLSVILSFLITLFKHAYPRDKILADISDILLLI